MSLPFEVSITTPPVLLLRGVWPKEVCNVPKDTKLFVGGSVYRPRAVTESSSRAQALQLGAVLSHPIHHVGDLLLGARVDRHKKETWPVKGMS